MATINFTQGKFESPPLSNGDVNNGGDVGFFVADGAYSTPLTTYSDSALTTSNAHPLVLDSAGRGTVFFSGNADVRIRDSSAATVYTQRNVNPSVLIASYLYSTAQTLTSVHAESMIEVTGTTTISLTAASTLAEGWRVWIKNTGSGVVTISRLAGGDKINGTAAGITLPAGSGIMVAVSDAVDGFTTYGVNLGDSNTWTGNNIFNLPQLFTNGIGADYINNAYFTATVDAKALTVTLVGNDGSAPSVTNPVQIAFRSATATTGTTSIRTVSATANVVAPSGATLGFIASATNYIYVYALDNAGTVEMAVSSVPYWDEGVLQSTTAIGTGSDLGTVLYSTTARTNVAIRQIGRFKIATGAVAGEWDNSPTELSPKQTQPVFGWNYIEKKTASSSATIDMLLPSGFDAFRISMVAIAPATDDSYLDIQVSNDSGSTFLGGTSYSFASRGGSSQGTAESLEGVATDSIKIGFADATDSIGNAAREALSGEIRVYGAGSASLNTRITGNGTYGEADGGEAHFTVGGVYNAAEIHNAIRFLFEAGNIDSGTFILEGLKTA